MIKLVFPIILLISLLSACSAGAVEASDESLETRGYTSTARLVSTDWVLANLENKNVKIIDIRKNEDYATGHLPGAINYSYKELQVEVDGVKGMIPEGSLVAEKLGALGITESDTIIIYDHVKNLWSTRFLWTLAVYGHEDARMMDGSFGLWEAQGKEISTDVISYEAVEYTFSSDVNSALIVNLEQVTDSITDPEKVVLDTRSADEYTGRDVRAERGGHIPGAIHVEWVNNVAEDGTFLPAEDLKALYVGSSVNSDQEVYALCQTAVRATHSWFVLSDLLGYENVAVYDGSWSEWGNREDTQIDQ